MHGGPEALLSLHFTQSYESYSEGQEKNRLGRRGEPMFQRLPVSSQQALEVFQKSQPQEAARTEKLSS